GQAIRGEHQSQEAKEKAHRQAHVEMHPRSYQNTQLRMPATNRTAIPRVSGRLYQTKCFSLIRSVREYTRPTSSFSTRGRVSRLTRMVARKQTVQAQIAVQKFWAI